MSSARGLNHRLISDLNPRVDQPHIPTPRGTAPPRSSDTDSPVPSKSFRSTPASGLPQAAGQFRHQAESGSRQDCSYPCDRNKSRNTSRRSPCRAVGGAYAAVSRAGLSDTMCEVGETPSGIERSSSVRRRGSLAARPERFPGGRCRGGRLCQLEERERRRAERPCLRPLSGCVASRAARFTPRAGTPTVLRTNFCTGLIPLPPDVGLKDG